MVYMIGKESTLNSKIFSKEEEYKLCKEHRRGKFSSRGGHMDARSHGFGGDGSNRVGSWSPFPPKIPQILVVKHMVEGSEVYSLD